MLMIFHNNAAWRYQLNIVECVRVVDVKPTHEQRNQITDAFEIMRMHHVRLFAQ
ncbi:MAG: hypothetical protein UX20_C0002G0002 [Candidatus Magasanikbacteria bacterium GW2011_GWC2_45_8]|uniref:Uncharacterized protein n=1 Tax=Candidatus Magasanikbacteria bacterium GW2011_GWC2_45_8 TaxID=1619050 RepID=A0A0G1R041_9BACT|nr:MAG: hypothetical protein UX20_C0002G0002 [Candidatus Magasanikbacteria bacterium GW2011_GWC2_45_8]